MTGIYGRSKAAKLIQEGRYQEAIEAATAAFAAEGSDASALFDRAAAHTALGQHDDAVADLEAALAADAGTGELDMDLVDDAYFTALLEVARQGNVGAAGAAGLDRYRQVLPRGQHHGDVTTWQKRLRGELPPSVIVKERE